VRLLIKNPLHNERYVYVRTRTQTSIVHLYTYVRTSRTYVPVDVKERRHSDTSLDAFVARCVMVCEVLRRLWRSVSYAVVVLRVVCSFLVGSKSVTARRRVVAPKEAKVERSTQRSTVRRGVLRTTHVVPPGAKLLIDESNATSTNKSHPSHSIPPPPHSPPFPFSTFS
jgi:hypothetical protein